MRTSTLLSAACCSLIAEAAPGLSFRQRRPTLPNFIERDAPNNATYASYTDNWAGAAVTGTGFESVTGTFVAPTAKLPSGGSSSAQYCIATWVGIDGRPCERAILQAGVDSCIQGSTATFSSWYEWYPDYSYRFNLSISAGDTIRVTMNASSANTGTAVMENLTSGKSVSHSFSSESAQLCQSGAEWIVEDFSSGGSDVPMANFGSVTFTNASATLTNGQTVGLSGAEIIDIEKRSKVMTDCSTPSSSSVQCSYVG